MLDFFIIILIICAVIVVILCIIGAFSIIQDHFKEKKEAEDRGQITSIYISHIYGIPWLECETVIALRLFREKIEIGNARELALNNITNIYIKKETELHNIITQKERSVLIRAGVGGVLLGPVGAVVGGLSGVPSKMGSKEVVSEKYYLIIEYKSKSGDEIKAIFGQYGGFMPKKSSMERFIISTINEIRKIKPYEFEREL